MAVCGRINADGVAFTWKKPFAFFMRQEITSINKVDAPESSKTSTFASNREPKLNLSRRAPSGPLFALHGITSRRFVNT